MLLKISLSKSITLATTFCNINCEGWVCLLSIWPCLFTSYSLTEIVVIIVLYCSTVVFGSQAQSHIPLYPQENINLPSVLLSSPQKIYLWLLLLATAESTYTEPCLVLGAVCSLDAQHILARTFNTASNTTPNNLSNKMLSSSWQHADWSNNNICALAYTPTTWTEEPGALAR